MNFFLKKIYFNIVKSKNNFFYILIFKFILIFFWIKGGTPTIFAPLVIVVFISMIKDLFEDLKRYKADK